MSDKVKNEYSNLKKHFKNIPKEKMKIVDGLIIQAARLKVGLDDAWADIERHGEYDMFYNSADSPGMERERPIAKIFTARHGAYQKTIGELLRLLPDEEDKETARRDLL